MTVKIVIEGEIPAIKNTLRFSRSGRPYHQDDGVKRYKGQFALQVPPSLKVKYGCPVRVDLVLYLKDRRKDGHNLMATVFDALEYSGVIKNDRQIVAWSGRTEIDHARPRVELIICPE